MKYLPSLSEALDWCTKAGVNKNWGSKTIPPEQLLSHSSDYHEKTPKNKSITKIAIHRSGFSCGNAALFRWYHRVINGWNDIGYHFVIGNGLKGFSEAGLVEQGRPLALKGAHCAGNNQDTAAICLTDNANHFKAIPPSRLELHALENALLYLVDKAGKECEIVGHSDLSSKNCPGDAVPLKILAEKIKRRQKNIRCKASRAVSLDLRHSFEEGVVDYLKPEPVLKKLSALGVTRIIFPFHGMLKPWEDLGIAKKWCQTAHKYNMDMLLYTGPFGTELTEFIKRDERHLKWLQRAEDGSIASYDKGGYLFMFCPSSPYLSEYRLPLIMKFMRETGCDGVFFGIPWIMGNACHCENCRTEYTDPENEYLQPKERIIRKALGQAVLHIRDEFPGAWLTANVSAPGIWDTDKIGATPLCLNGIFDELVVEWTPIKGSNLENIKRSIAHTRSLAPTCRISHTWQQQKRPDLVRSMGKLHGEEGVGEWHTDTFFYR